MSRGFVCQTKKVNLRGHILFSVLASLFAHQSGQSLYIALEGCNRKNFHRLTFCERKFRLFGWQRTLFFDLAYVWPTKRSGIWAREFTFLIWQTKPRDLSHVNCHAYLGIGGLPVSVILVSQNNATAPMMVFQTSPVEADVFFGLHTFLLQ